MALDSIAAAAIHNALNEVGDTARRVTAATVPATETAEAATRPDLSTEIVRLLQSQRHFEVAVEIARTADEMTETTLDLLR